jgi:hypothetical protein
VQAEAVGAGAGHARQGRRQVGAGAQRGEREGQRHQVQQPAQHGGQHGNSLARRAPETGLAPARRPAAHETREAHMMLPVQIKHHLEGGRAGTHGR